MLILAAALILAITGVMAGWLLARSWVWRSRRHRRFVVTLKSGDGFSGVLAAVDSSALVLKDAEKIGDGSVPVDGEVIVLLADVKYAQRL